MADRTPPAPPPFIACPLCAAVVVDDTVHVEHHVTWHEGTKTLGPRRGGYGTAAALCAGFARMRAAADRG